MDEKDKYVEKDTETESMNSSPTPISASSLVESTNNKYKNDQTNEKKKISDAKVNTRGSQINKEKRCQTYTVVLNCEDSNSTLQGKSKFPGFGGFIILIWTVVFTTPITLWPQINVIQNPEYWYEPLGPISASYTVSGAALTCLECWAVLKLDNFLSCSMFMKQILIGSLGFIAPYTLSHLIWVHLLGYRHPMPRVGDVSLTICYIFRGFGLWYLISCQPTFKDALSRQRLLIFLCFFPVRILQSVLYMAVSNVLLTLSHDYQWCAALFFPLIRKLFELISVEIGFKAAGEKNIPVKLALICHVACLHTVTLSTLLGSDIASTTAYVLMIVECLPNMISTANIMRSETNVQEREIAIKCLTMREFLEVLIPAAYSLSFLIAYYGPNAEILGIVKNNYWQYKKIENVFKKLMRIGLLFTVDVVRAIIISLVLGFVCNFNMYKIYCQITHRYGFMFLAYLSAFLNLVFSYYNKLVLLRNVEMAYLLD